MFHRLCKRSVLKPWKTASSCRTFCAARSNVGAVAQPPSFRDNNKSSLWAYGISAAALTLSASLIASCDDSSSSPRSPVSSWPTHDQDKPAQGINNEELPLITLAEMDKLRESGRIVVSFQGIVYDVSDFTGHPGGVGRLEMANGNDLEPFWKVYTQHNRGHITEVLLARYKIAILSEDEAEAIRNRTMFANPYLNEPGPETYPELLVNTRHPFNAEGRLRDLRESWVTPIGRHFVRNHNVVPDIDPEEYRLHVSGVGMKDTTFTLEELKKFPQVEVTSVIQCNGNRREDFHFIDGKTPAFGPPHWVAGAIGNSTWTGVRMRDVLRAAGMDVDAISLRQVEAPPTATHVGLTGYDQDEVGNQYCCSFPFEKAIDPFGDVILAYQMNGQDIPRSHGYPVRAIVPGNAGARNCKYLERITVNDHPCCDNCNWKQYAVHAPDVPLSHIADFEKHAKELKVDPPVQEMPVQSMITYPSAGDVLCAKKMGCACEETVVGPDEAQVKAAAATAATTTSSSSSSGCGTAAAECKTPTVHVKGIAWGGGGEGINRVDVSLDGGRTFTRAEQLPAPIKQRRKANWGWVFFEKDVPIPETLLGELRAGKPVKLELVSKALNSSWNVQPERAEPNMNAHGCCVNHWYRVPVTICPKTQEDVPSPVGDFANKPSGGVFRKPFRNLDPPVRLTRNGYPAAAAAANARARTEAANAAAATNTAAAATTTTDKPSPMAFSANNDTKQSEGS